MMKLSSDEFVGDSDSFKESFSEEATNKDSNNEQGLRWTWNEESIYRLIKLWRDRPLLYNIRHLEYTNKISRRLALEEISEDLNVSMEELSSKMVSLRTYYGSQQRKKIAWEKKGLSAFKSKWQFFDSLGFLQDYMTQKPSESRNVMTDSDVGEDHDAGRSCEENQKEDNVVTPNLANTKRSVEISSLAYPKRKISYTKEVTENHDFAEKSELDTLHSDAKRTRVCAVKQAYSRSEDELFIEMLSKSLAKIAEGEAKEALKIDIQNLVFKVRFGQQRLQSHSSEQMTLQEQNFDNGFLASSRDDCNAAALSICRRKSSHPQKATNGKDSTAEYSMVSFPSRSYDQQE